MKGIANERVVGASAYTSPHCFVTELNAEGVLCLSGLYGGGPFEVGQPQSFQLFHAEAYFLKGRDGDALGLEIRHAGRVAHMAAVFGARHRISFRTFLKGMFVLHK